MTIAEERAPASLEGAVAAAVSARRPSEGAGPVANVLTFGWRALLKVKHMPEQLFDVLVTPVMFTVLFTYLFGGALAGSPEEYLQFLLPGILVQTIVFTSVYTGFTLNTDISKGIFERFRAMPVWRPAPIVGGMVGDTLRYTVSQVIVVVIGLIMGFRPEAGIGGIIAAMLLLDLFALGLGWIFNTVALIVRTPATVMTMSFLVLMPVTFASNIFVSPDTMPGWLQTFVAVNPVALLVTAVRGAMAGTATLAEIGLALVAPAIITLVFAPLAMRLYARRQ